MINVIAAASWAMPGVGCAIAPILQIGAAMYRRTASSSPASLSSGTAGLAEGDGAKNGSNGAHHANGNGVSLGSRRG